MKHFLVMPLNLPISDSERSREIILDIKFDSVRDTLGWLKSNLILWLLSFCQRKTSSQSVHRLNRDIKLCITEEQFFLRAGIAGERGVFTRLELEM